MKKFAVLLVMLIFLSFQAKVLAEEIEIPHILFDPGVVNNFHKELIDELMEKEEEPDEGEAKEKEAPEFESVKPINNTQIKISEEFELKQVSFSGNTVFKDNELLIFFQPLIGKKIRMSEAVEAVEQINKMYDENGYYTSYAYIASFNSKNNSISVKITEGKIGQINIEGNKYSKAFYLKNMLLASKGVEQDKVLNINNIDKAVEEMNSTGYMKAQIAVDKTEDSDTNNLNLKIEEKRPIKFHVMWDNDGNELIGQNRATMLLSKDNLFGLGHQIYGGAVLAKGATGILTGYKMPVGKHGTELQFDYSFVNLNLLDDYDEYHMNGRAHKFSARAVQPLYNKKDWIVNTDLGVDFLIADSIQYSEYEPINSYRLTVLRSGFNAVKRDKNGLFSGRLENSFGVPILGSTQDNYSYFSNDTGEAQSAFYKLKVSLERLQKLPKDCIGIFRITGQYSPNNLYPTEQMNFGGLTTMRGYEPGEILSDMGVNGTFEVRTPIPFFKQVLPKKLKHISDRVKLGFFYDWGVFSNQHTGVQMSGNSNFLQSVGCGIHLKLTDSLTASWEIGVPVGSSEYHGKDAVMYFAVKAELGDLCSFKKKAKEEKI